PSLPADRDRALPEHDRHARSGRHHRHGHARGCGQRARAGGVPAERVGAANRDRGDRTPREPLRGGTMNEQPGPLADAASVRRLNAELDAKLLELARGVSSDELYVDPEDGEWNLSQNLAHLGEFP